MNRVIRDGKVAVLYSPGYGAGWSTWSSAPREEKLFDPEMVEAALAQDQDRMKAIAQRKWPDDYDGALEGLTVGWVDVGAMFRIVEYDGSESIALFDPDDFVKA